MTNEIFDEEVKVSDVVKHQCEMCNKVFNKYVDADKCEKIHKKNKDKHYFWYREEQNKQKLLKAANHKSQKKLICY